jgi:hypothetical protein
MKRETGKERLREGNRGKRQGERRWVNREEETDGEIQKGKQGEV